LIHITGTFKEKQIR